MRFSSCKVKLLFSCPVFWLISTNRIQLGCSIKKQAYFFDIFWQLPILRNSENLSFGQKILSFAKYFEFLAKQIWFLTFWYSWNFKFQGKWLSYGQILPEFWKILSFDQSEFCSRCRKNKPDIATHRNSFRVIATWVEVKIERAELFEIIRALKWAPTWLM